MRRTRFGFLSATPADAQAAADNVNACQGVTKATRLQHRPQEI